MWSLQKSTEPSVGRDLCSSGSMEASCDSHPWLVLTCSQHRGICILQWTREISNFILSAPRQSPGTEAWAGTAENTRACRIKSRARARGHKYQSLQVLELVSQLEELCGGEQDSVEGVDHGGGKLEVFLSE